MIKAVSNYVIAEFIDDGEIELESGLILQAEVGKRLTRLAKVLAVGPEVRYVSEGDTVCMRPHLVTTFNLGDARLCRVKEVDIEYVETSE